MLTVTQTFDFAVHEFGGEEKVRERAAAGGVFDARVRAKFINHGFVRIQARKLSKIADF